MERQILNLGVLQKFDHFLLNCTKETNIKNKKR